ncbi:thiamine phosphate synthase [uncultured Duncaniella sp.]|uniref:thiamine phosphate synthase n=1 Tax=uncultured Duncaniella sp. TaxID=2768039 RepID=UPI0026EFA0D5|nr:thiamine phosphate synthase [uncultured Duncaniella sp.]
MDRFIAIVITEPEFIDDEAVKIVKLLQSGVDYVHIRKPGAELCDVVRLIEVIPADLRLRLKIHDNFELTKFYDLGGIQLNLRSPKYFPSVRHVSRSCHSIEEVDKYYGECQYVTLSPIFDSISKKGYVSKFNLDGIKSKIIGKNVIALGGVTPENLHEVKDVGFSGAAMLGCVWKDIDMFIERLNRFKTT